MPPFKYISFIHSKCSLPRLGSQRELTPAGWKALLQQKSLLSQAEIPGEREGGRWERREDKEHRLMPYFFKMVPHQGLPSGVTSCLLYLLVPASSPSKALHSSTETQPCRVPSSVCPPAPTWMEEQPPCGWDHSSNPGTCSVGQWWKLSSTQCLQGRH